ncbi:MAG: hypothetical protein ACE5G8_02265 [Anaerolineae bacterium]
MQQDDIVYDAEPQSNNTTRNIIIAVVVLVFLCCCCAALGIGLMAASGVFDELANELGVLRLAVEPLLLVV